MSINTALRRRQLGLSGRIEIDFIVNKIRLKEVMRLPNCFYGELETPRGPMASTRLNHDTIAIATEDGCVSLIGAQKFDSKTYWSAHDNAIFDIKTSVDQRSLFTGSGDRTVRVWDVEKKKETENFSPHFSTVKSLSVYDANTIASGSRDGTIKVHDLRVKEKTVIIISDAHRNTIIRKTAPKLNCDKTDPVCCVTNVLFDPYSPRLYSAGANDATLKLWDLRKTSSTNRLRRTRDGQILLNQPYHEVVHPTRGSHCGYSQLLISSGRLYAACSDNKIYCYERFDSKVEPRRFTGFEYDPNVRLAIMDDRFLCSGAIKGGGVVVWSLGRDHSKIYYPKMTIPPIGQLRPDINNTNDTNAIEIDWDSLSIISMRDDGLVCKWTMQHVPEHERKRLICDNYLSSLSEDITIEMGDIIDVNVLRPNQRISNVVSQQYASMA